MSIVALHSYKGGTGKTLLSVNLAILLATMGKRVCLLDLDLHAPSLHAIFINQSNYWVNDYLNRACEIEKVLADCTAKEMSRGKLFVGLANPSTEAIREVGAKDRKWDMNVLTRLISLRTSLVEDKHFDYVLLDSSPGLNYSSINTIVCADIVLAVTSIDKSDIEGTRRMIRELYELFGKKTGIVINKVPSEYSISKTCNEGPANLHTHRLPVIGVIPCSCDVKRAGEKCLSACYEQDPSFMEKMREIIANLERFRVAADEECGLTFFILDALTPKVTP